MMRAATPKGSSCFTPRVVRRARVCVCDPGDKTPWQPDRMDPRSPSLRERDTRHACVSVCVTMNVSCSNVFCFFSLCLMSICTFFASSLRSCSLLGKLLTIFFFCFLLESSPRTGKCVIWVWTRTCVCLCAGGDVIVSVGVCVSGAGCVSSKCVGVCEVKLRSGLVFCLLHNVFQLFFCFASNTFVFLSPFYVALFVLIRYYFLVSASNTVLASSSSSTTLLQV